MKARQVRIWPPAKQVVLNEFSWQWLLIDIGWHWMLPPANWLTWLPAHIQLAGIEPQFNRIVQVHKNFTEKIQDLEWFLSLISGGHIVVLFLIVVVFYYPINWSCSFLTLSWRKRKQLTTKKKSVWICKLRYLSPWLWSQL